MHREEVLETIAKVLEVRIRHTLLTMRTRGAPTLLLPSEGFSLEGRYTLHTKKQNRAN